MQARIKDIEKAGIVLVAISYDTPEKLKKFATENKITFPLLSDPDSKIIDAYHVRNKRPQKDSFQYGIPHPGTFVLDGQGRVRAKLFRSVTQRHSVDELIDAVSAIRKQNHDNVTNEAQ